MLFWIFANLNISSLFSFPLLSSSSPPLLCSSIKVSGCQQKVWRALQNQKKNSKKEEKKIQKQKISRILYRPHHIFFCCKNFRAFAQLKSFCLKKHFVKTYIHATLEKLFPSNHNIHKISRGLCFWASDTLIERFY